MGLCLSPNKFRIFTSLEATDKLEQCSNCIFMTVLIVYWFTGISIKNLWHFMLSMSDIFGRLNMS